MATPWTFEQRLAAYRAEGITKIVVMPNARNHNRDSATGRTFGPVHGVVIHHTVGVGSGMKNVIYNGVSGLPGPLSQDFLAKDGTLYVVGHGRANHAGTTTPAVKAAIIDERAPSNQRDIGSETVDGNDFLYGLEIENEGDGDDPYPSAQYDVAIRWAAAHLRHHGWSENSAWGHKEITRRKIDPSFSMTAFRAAVKARLANEEEEDVALSADDKNWLRAEIRAAVKEEAYKAVWHADAMEPPTGHATAANPTWWGANVLRWTAERAEAVEKKVDALSTGGVNEDALADKLADRLAARLAE